MPPATPDYVGQLQRLIKFYSTFWASRIDAEQAQPRRLWRSFGDLLGCGRAPPTDVNATVLHCFFDEKVASVHAATADADPPTFSPVRDGCALVSFEPVTITDVERLVRSLPDK